MRLTIERLRTWIVLLAVVLVIAIVGFFGYARYRVRHFGRDLPGKLGIEIQQSTNGFTFSKSEKGRTLFTLHASKAVQYKGGGRMALHDVSILLYGKDGKQADHMYGSEFEYDPQTSIARATGEVEIELAAPVGQGSAGTQPGGGAKPVHVKTSGLVFNQKTGEANTPELVEFAFAGGQGNAKGASYDSTKGVLVLASDVLLKTELNNEPLTVRASNAQFGREIRQVTLLQDVAEYGDERSTSDQALVTFRADGSAEKIDARGHVHVTGSDRELHSSIAEVTMDEKSQPQLVALNGGVLFSAKDTQRNIQGNANMGVLQIGPSGSLKHLQMRNAVSVVDQESSGTNDGGVAITREVQATTLDIDFAAGPERRAEARSLLAKGAATVTERKMYPDSPPQSTTIKGDQLFATLRNGQALSTLRGDGDTFLTNSSPSGVSQTSKGDSLEITFAREDSLKPGLKKKTKAADTANIPGLVEKAVQAGHVQLIQTQPGDHDATEPTRYTASAEKATFDGATQSVRLEGGTPRLTEEGSELTANSIVFHRMTGEAEANGGVKTTYQQGSGGGDPVHVVAGAARFDRARDEATFLGASGTDARLWQGADSISAPTIVVARKLGTLTAHGAGGRTAVHAVFAESNGAKGKPGTAPGAAVVRVTSASLVYSAAERTATLKGDVLAQNGTAQIRAANAEVFLASAAAAGGKGTRRVVPNPGGAVERIVAQGGVQFAAPGKKGSGEKLVYTAQDSRFVLTGTAAKPPQLTDAMHGSVTGASLLFTNRDDSVVVNGGASSAVTETRVPK